MKSAPTSRTTWGTLGSLTSRGSSTASASTEEFVEVREAPPTSIEAASPPTGGPSNPCSGIAAAPSVSVDVEPSIVGESALSRSAASAEGTPPAKPSPRATSTGAAGVSRSAAPSLVATTVDERAAVSTTGGRPVVRSSSSSGSRSSRQSKMAFAFPGMSTKIASSVISMILPNTISPSVTGARSRGAP